MLFIVGLNKVESKIKAMGKANYWQFLTITFVVFIFAAQGTFGNDNDDKVAQYKTFRGTRIINGHSIELLRKGNFDFLISHKFGRLNTGMYQFFGLDEANIRLGLDYGLSDRINLGIGRNSVRKTYDGYINSRLLTQDYDNTLVSINLLGAASIVSQKLDFEGVHYSFKSRVSYTSQLLIARVFNEHLSMQLTPSFIHKNMVPHIADKNNFWAIGYATRYKLNYSLALILEYHYSANNNSEEERKYNSIGIGLEIETKGHVFQINLTNSRSMIEKSFITETTGNFFKGDIHLGFNMSRGFKIGEKRY